MALLLSIPEAAAELVVSRATLYRMIGAGEIATVRLRARRMIRPAALESYLRTNQHYEGERRPRRRGRPGPL